MLARPVPQQAQFRSAASSTALFSRLLPVHPQRVVRGRRYRLDTLCKLTASLKNENPKHTQTEIVLDRAEEDLRELCTSEEATPESWLALDYLVGKRRKFSERCDLEDDNGPHDADSCDSLVRLGNFARELMASGSIRNFRDNLLIMKRAEERKAAEARQAASGIVAEVAASPSQVETMSREELHERADLIRLFHQLDKNQDGEICILELLDGIETMGAVLTENDIQQIHDALDASDGEGLDNGRNRLDVDDFLSVCAASPLLRGVALGGGNANFLRHAAQAHGHTHPGNAGHLRPRRVPM